MGQWGCVGSPTVYPKPESLLEKYRGQLGIIGVVRGQVVPVFQFDRPLPLETEGVLERTGRGALEGGQKSGQWLLDLCPPDNKSNVEKRMVGVVIYSFALPVVLVGVCYILTVPVAILGGFGSAIYGAFRPAKPPAYVEAAEATLGDFLEKYPIQETFQSFFLKEARTKTSHTFAVIPEQGPRALESLERFDDGQTYEELPTNEGIGGQGVDSVLELSVKRLWLKRAADREGEMNPPMVFALFVRARLFQGTEKTVWYDQTFVYETKRRLYTLWPYPLPVVEDIEKAYQHLAEEMVKKLFLMPTSSIDQSLM